MSQRELLQEGFTDKIRGVAAVARSIGKGVVDPLQKAWDETAGKYLEQQPVSFLKNLLKKEKNIEFIKFLGEEKRQANKNKPWYKRIFGPKNVTLIKFKATLYRKGPARQPVRDYQGYNDSVDNSGKAIILEAAPTGTPTATPTTAPTGTPTTAPTGTPTTAPTGTPTTAPTGTPTATQPVQGTNTANQPINTNLIAEIFRTRRGLELGDIYDEVSNEVVFRGSEITGDRKDKKITAAQFNVKMRQFENNFRPLVDSTTMFNFIELMFPDLSTGGPTAVRATYPEIYNAINVSPPNRNALVRALTTYGFITQ